MAKRGCKTMEEAEKAKKDKNELRKEIGRASCRERV